MLNRRHFLSLTTAAALVPAALRAQGTPAIIATTGMIADAARALSGGPVTALMGPGTDPHMYRQTRSDIAALARADLVLWHGLYLEAQMEDFFLDLARRTKVIAVAEALPKDQLLSHAQYQGRHDPHVWMDPVLWSGVTDAIAAALTGLMPGAAGAIAANATAYKAEAAALHTYSTEILATVPGATRTLVTAHDAFSYFGRAYDFGVEGIQGISTESEAGLARVGQLVDLLVANRIPAVFVESSVSDRSVRALVEGAAAKGHSVIIGGQLYSDAMGPDGSYEGTWAGMIDHNVTLITRALGGTAPARGRLGKLAEGS